MGAVLGLVAFIIAGILKLVGKGSTKDILWLLIIGGILVCAEVIWGWHRGGYYRRGPGAPAA